MSNVFIRKFAKGDDYLNSVVEKIKLLATKKGESLASLERNLGLANGSISRWKQNTPSADKLQKVADFLGVTVDYLLTEGEESLEFFAIQRKSKKLSKKDQQRLLKIMEATFDEIDNGDFEEDEDDDL